MCTALVKKGRLVLISRCSRNINLPDYDCKQKLFCSLRCEQIRCVIVPMFTLDRRKEQITPFRDPNGWVEIKRKSIRMKFWIYCANTCFLTSITSAHTCHVWLTCVDQRSTSKFHRFSLSAPKKHFAPHSTFSSFFVWNSPSNFVAQRFGWDNSGFLTDTLVCVEVHCQPSVVFLDNDLSGLLDSLRAYATLWNCNNALFEWEFIQF